MKNLFRLDFLPRHYDLAMLLLRVWFGLSLFLGHGVEKISNFASMSEHFPNPLGIGPVPSLILALISDAICSVLLIIGFATRLAALYIAIILGVAFIFVHHFALTGPHNGELAWAYIGVCLAIFIAGPGRFSIDGSKAKKL